MHTPPAQTLPLANSLLFVPGDRPERFEKALASGAHQVIIDLEDAVAEPAKARARQAACAFFRQGGRALLRINALGTQWAQDDLALCCEKGVLGVVLPKAQAQSCVSHLSQHIYAHTGMHTPVLPLIETALGILNVRDIASAPTVSRLILGTVDLCLDLNIEDSGTELNTHRAWLVLASRAARLQAPIDGVTLKLDDPASLKHATWAAKRMGFGGKLCIHPLQVATVNDCFLATPAQIDWAKRVITHSKSQAGTFQFEGKMVDTPIIAQAYQLLAQQPQ